MTDMIPERLRVTSGVTIENGVVTSHQLGECFASDPDRAFGPEYVLAEKAEEEKQAMLNDWAIERSVLTAQIEKLAAEVERLKND